MKMVLLAFSAPLIGTVGQLLLKYVMLNVGPVVGAGAPSPLQTGLRLLGNPLFLLAVLLYAVGFVIWLAVLSKLDLSYAYPILALSYCIVPFCSWLLLNDQVSPMRWLGILVICVGVVIVGLSR